MLLHFLFDGIGWQVGKLNSIIPPRSESDFLKLKYMDFFRIAVFISSGSAPFAQNIFYPVAGTCICNCYLTLFVGIFYLHVHTSLPFFS